MKKVWSVLNSPLVVVLIVLISWPIFTALSGAYALKFGLNEIASSVSNEVIAPFKQMGVEQDDELKIIIAEMKNIEVSNVSYAQSKWPGRVKVIGTIKNNTGSTIKSINITSSFYRAEKLVDVTNEWLSGIKALRPGESSDFTFDKELAKDEQIEGLSAQLKVSSFEILK